MNKRLTKISKYLTFVLRHEPGSIGLKLDSTGWVDVAELIQRANASGKAISQEQVREVVKISDAKRFELSEDGLQIRCQTNDQAVS